MPIQFLNFLNPDGTIFKLRKDLTILSIIALVFKEIANTIHGTEDLSLTFPLWFLPQKSIFSFLIGYFFTHGVTIALSILFWAITFLLVTYFIKLRCWKAELLLLEIEQERQQANNQIETISKLTVAGREMDVKGVNPDRQIDRLKEMENQYDNCKAPNKHRAAFSLFAPILLFLYAIIVSFPEGISLFVKSWPY